MMGFRCTSCGDWHEGFPALTAATPDYWLSNEVQFFPSSLHLKLKVWPQRPGLRPLFEVEPTDHPLSLAQLDGIPFEEALGYVHAVLEKT